MTINTIINERTGTCYRRGNRLIICDMDGIFTYYNVGKWSNITVEDGTVIHRGEPIGTGPKTPLKPLTRSNSTIRLIRNPKLGVVGFETL